MSTLALDKEIPLGYQIRLNSVVPECPDCMLCGAAGGSLLEDVYSGVQLDVCDVSWYTSKGWTHWIVKTGSFSEEGLAKIKR